jgi:septum site-determining protein MinC
LAGLDFDLALADLTTKLSERPGFYRGSSATAVVADPVPSDEQIASLRSLLEEHGLTLAAVEHAEGQELARRRALRPRRELKLSDSARSLVADFAGARSDIADRRKKGESSVRRVHREPDAPPPPPPQPLQVAPPPPGTLYHVGTLRGGQALHHVGNIIVVGDVNPGTELVATGDIVVFGRLLGVAHAGAQGDESAKVYALHMQATQLRIATSIALDEDTRASASQPEIAFLRDGRIVIAPFSKAAEVLT